MSFVEPLICGANNYANPQLLSDACLEVCHVGECHVISVKDNFVVSLTGMWRTQKVCIIGKLLSTCCSLFGVQES